MFRQTALPVLRTSATLGPNFEWGDVPVLGGVVRDRNGHRPRSVEGVTHPLPTATQLIEDRRRGQSVDNPVSAAVPLIRRWAAFVSLGVSRRTASDLERCTGADTCRWLHQRLRCPDPPGVYDKSLVSGHLRHTSPGHRRGRPCGVPSRRTQALAAPTRATTRVAPTTPSLSRHPRPPRICRTPTRPTVVDISSQRNLSCLD